MDEFNIDIIKESIEEESIFIKVEQLSHNKFPEALKRERLK